MLKLVDSCGWLEYFADGPNAGFFAPAIEDLPQLLVPSLCLFEVFKRVLVQRGEHAALRCIALMRQARVVDLDETLAIASARLSAELRLAMADSIILCTARQRGAQVLTQDAAFERLPGVRYIAKT